MDKETKLDLARRCGLEKDPCWGDFICEGCQYTGSPHKPCADRAGAERLRKFAEELRKYKN